MKRIRTTCLDEHPHRRYVHRLDKERAPRHWISGDRAGPGPDRTHRVRPVKGIGLGIFARAVKNSLLGAARIGLSAGIGLLLAVPPAAAWGGHREDPAVAAAAQDLAVAARRFAWSVRRHTGRSRVYRKARSLARAARTLHREAEAGAPVGELRWRFRRLARRFHSLERAYHRDHRLYHRFIERRFQRLARAYDDLADVVRWRHAHRPHRWRPHQWADAY